MLITNHEIDTTDGVRSVKKKVSITIQETKKTEFLLDYEQIDGRKGVRTFWQKLSFNLFKSKVSQMKKRNK